MVLYMAVTPDKYELPIAVETSVTYLGLKLGIDPRKITKYVDPRYDGSRIGVRFMRVEVDE